MNNSLCSKSWVLACISHQKSKYRAAHVWTRANQKMNYSIERLQINQQLIGPSDNPFSALPDFDGGDCRVDILFDSKTKSLQIQSRDSNTRLEKPTYSGITVIGDPTIGPSEDNTKIGLACLLLPTNGERDPREFRAGPFIQRSKKMRGLPGKWSPVGGLFDQEDETCETTVMREFREELRLDEYMELEWLNKIRDTLSLSHLIFSHPSVGITESRRFNITLVFHAVISLCDGMRFRQNVFQESEVERVIMPMYVSELVASLENVSPFAAMDGWTPNAAAIILHYISQLYSNQVNSLGMAPKPTEASLREMITFFGLMYKIKTRTFYYVKAQERARGYYASLENLGTFIGKSPVDRLCKDPRILYRYKDFEITSQERGVEYVYDAVKDGRVCHDYDQS